MSYSDLSNRSLTQEEWVEIQKHQDKLYFETVDDMFNYRLKPRLLKFEKEAINSHSLLKNELDLIQNLLNVDISEPKKDLFLNVFGILDPQNFPSKADRVLMKHKFSFSEHNIHHSDCLSYIETPGRSVLHHIETNEVVFSCIGERKHT